MSQQDYTFSLTIKIILCIKRFLAPNNSLHKTIIGIRQFFLSNNSLYRTFLCIKASKTISASIAAICTNQLEAPNNFLREPTSICIFIAFNSRQLQLIKVSIYFFFLICEQVLIIIILLQLQRNINHCIRILATLTTSKSSSIFTYWFHRDKASTHKNFNQDGEQFPWRWMEIILAINRNQCRTSVTAPSLSVACTTSVR